MPYEDVIRDLRIAYDRNAEARAQSGVDAWKIAERWRFLGWLQAERRDSLLEIGSGPGMHGKFFQEQGLAAVCTDLSPEHVRLCKANGLEAYALDFLSLPTLGRRSPPFSA